MQFEVERKYRVTELRALLARLAELGLGLDDLRAIAGQDGPDRLSTITKASGMSASSSETDSSASMRAIGGGASPSRG